MTGILDRGEIKALTALRGMGAMLVIVYHFRKEFGHTLDLDHYTGFFGKGYLWVDFFFILSGFVMALVHASDFADGFSLENYKIFLVKRIGRIYPLHIFTLLLFIPTEAAKLVLPSSADPAFSSNSFGAIVSNVFLVQSWHLHAVPTWNRPSWSISAEWASYLLFPLLVPLVMRASAALSALVSTCVILGLWALIVFAGHGDLSNVMQDFGVLRCLASFVLGMQIFRLCREGNGRILDWIGGSFSLAVASVALVLAMHFRVFDLPLVILFAWLVTSAAVGRSRLHRWLESSPFYFFGVISYSIYLDHSLAQRAWQFIWDRWAGATFGTFQSCLTLLAVLVLVPAGAFVTYRLIELPGRRLAKRFTRRWEGSPVPLRP